MMGPLYLVFMVIASGSVACVVGAYLCFNCLYSSRVKAVDDI